MVTFTSFRSDTTKEKKKDMLYIHGLGHFHPDNIIDNTFLENLDIGTNDEWIIERVGIKTRRTVLPLSYIAETRNADPRAAMEASEYSNATTGKLAAEMALDQAGISADQIGLVMAGGCSPDTVTPAEACTIASALGIEAQAFDLNSACSSFGAQMFFISMMNPESLPEFILLVSPENNTRTIDYRDRNTAVLWGDGTSAAVVSTRHPASAKVEFNTLTSSPQGWDKVVIPRLGHFRQEGATVQTFAIKRTVKCYREISNGQNGQNRPLFFIGHQANLKMLESVCERCQIARDRHLFNVDVFGNTGAAGAPIVLSQNWSGFKHGDRVALIVVGAGLTWSSMTIEFNFKPEDR
ncbi:MAG: 3-oxoacyl-ACP synthase III family protein [bacterium]